jgi:soluble lytic murein transglycosylase
MPNIYPTRFILLLSFILFLNTSVFALNGDTEFLAARNAYDKKNAIALSDYVQQLQNQNYILAPYASYWLMLLNLEDADNQTISDFIYAYSEYPFADRVRGEYLKKLAKNQDWETFSSEIVNYQQEDVAVSCYAAEAKAMNGDNSLLEEAKSLWMTAKEQPANCASMFDRMQSTGVLKEEDIWARFRLALAENRMMLAKTIIKRSKSYEASQIKLIDKAYANPSVVLAKKSISFKTKLGRELNLFALIRLAKSDSQQALSAFNKIHSLFPAEDKSYFYGRLALQAALRHEPEALQWYRLAENEIINKENIFNKDQLAWYVRTALREKNWTEVLNAVAKMSPEQLQEGAWRYWKARALKAQNKTLDANIIFAKLSTERHFYGWLAQDELVDMMSAPLEIYKVSDLDVEEIATNPAFQRVEALQRLDFRWEAKSEWALATKDFDDKQFLAAAEFAVRKNWYDLAIITADKTTQVHDFALRYPMPYRNLIKSAAEERGVDEAWVYGITRQESRFMHYAKSGVGAAGLMQLMPATAKWAASRAGINDYNNSMIHDLDTNITLGTYYMAYTKDIFIGQETMATAAYNAGPSRAKKWVSTVPLEGAIYIETIPFSETRSYVQKVMANAHLYAPRLGLKSISLKQRLGTVPSRYAGFEANIDQSENQEVPSQQTTIDIQIAQ